MGWRVQCGVPRSWAQGCRHQEDGVCGAYSVEGRDAEPQISSGEDRETESLNFVPRDAAFWGNEKGRATAVGLGVAPGDWERCVQESWFPHH